jgi:acyl-coenzyme A thioesterase PaaI-like protein
LDGSVQYDRGRSTQETYYPELTCFGCGQVNERGLRLQSYEVDGVVRATFVPWPEHDNGSGYLNGGIISTVLDCHATAAVQLEAHRQGWHPAPGSGLSFVTAALDVRFLRPTPLRESVALTAELLAVAEPEVTAVSHAISGGKTTATATSVWKRWRPRS